MKTCSVLCVDDEPRVLAAMKLTLRHEPVRLVGAEHAREALDLMSRSPFDAVIVDEYMPGMLGSRLLEVIQSRWPETLRVAMTGLPGTASFQRLCHHGAAELLLVKPFAPESLVAALSQMRKRPDG